MNNIPVEEQTEKRDEGRDEFYYRIIDGVNEHTNILAYCTLATIIFIISAILLCIYGSQVKSFSSAHSGLYSQRRSSKICANRKADRWDTPDGSRKQHSGHQLIASWAPAKTLAIDPAIPQLCGLRPVTEKSEI